MKITSSYLFAPKLTKLNPDPRQDAIDDLVERIKQIRIANIYAYTDTLSFDFPIQKAIERVYTSSYQARWNRGYPGTSGKGYNLGTGFSELPVYACMYLADDYYHTDGGDVTIKRWKSLNDCLTVWGVHTSNWYDHRPTDQEWNLVQAGCWYDRNDQKPQGVLAYDDYLVFENGLYQEYIRKQKYATTLPHFLNVSDASSWATLIGNYSQGSETIETLQSYLEDKYYYMNDDE